MKERQHFPRQRKSMTIVEVIQKLGRLPIPTGMNFPDPDLTGIPLIPIPSVPGGWYVDASYNTHASDWFDDSVAYPIADYWQMVAEIDR